MDDLLPRGLRWLRRLAHKGLRALPGARARRHARLRDALDRSRRVLVVCAGNICRSPFAERYLRSRFGERWSVRSSGYYPQSGRPSPPEAVELAGKYRVDQHDHRSHVLTPDDVEWAEVVLLFDGRNHDRLRHSYPDQSAKLHFVGDIPRSGTSEIADPFGKGDAAYQVAYRRIVTALDALGPEAG